MEIINGFIETVDNSTISGWAFHPNLDTSVDIYIFGHLVSTVKADINRSDVLNAGYEKSNCGFNFKVSPEHRFDFPLGPFDVVCKISGTNFFLKRNKREFISSYGGLWIDRPNYEEILRQKRELNHVDYETEKLVINFIRDGYAVINRGVSPQLCDKLNAEIENIWDDPPERAIMSILDNTHIKPDKLLRSQPTKLLDVYGFSSTARDVISSKPLKAFLSAIFEERPCAFQSLSFYRGSEQPIHKDTAYVRVIGNPMALAACWIALEDVLVNTGELEYFVGSHKSPDYNFTSGKWMMEHNYEHNSFLTSLLEDAKRLNQPKKSFLAKKGDILIWHADLAHGGAPLDDKNKTRKSLVVHFCPENCNPYWRILKKNSNKREFHNGMFFESQHIEIDESLKVE